MDSFEDYMRIAIDEARTSLREGNCGFGAIIVKNNKVISTSHDTEKTESDPTAHAEMKTIRLASKELGRKLEGCQLISTHEPCPMCAVAIVWSGIEELAFGYSIKDAIKQGRKRIDLTCNEIFQRAGINIIIHENILKYECSILYNESVRNEIEKFRGISENKIKDLESSLCKNRVDWFADNKDNLNLDNDDNLINGYNLFLNKLGVSSDDAPVVERQKDKLLIHSKNFCPTLEACTILGLDTRVICRNYSEKPTDILLKQLDPKLGFQRNYKKLRPYADYCEEMIVFTKNKKY